MAFLYPWGNTQQLNLDWILQKIKELEAGSGGADLDEVANALISASYSRQAYDRSDIVFYDGKLYRANQAIPAPGEVWTPAHWDEILLGDTVSNLVQYVAALSNDQIVNSSSVSGTHTSDALDTLKNAIDNMTLDSDSVTNESQVTGTTVTDALETLDSDIQTNAGDIATLFAQYKLNKLYRFYIPNGTQIAANDTPTILKSWTADDTVLVENGKIHITGSGFALVLVHVVGSCGNNRLWYRVQGVNTNTQHISYGAYCTGELFTITQYSPGADDYIWLEFMEPLLVGGGGTGTILIYVMLL